MTTRIAINGFGRIGRTFFKEIFEDKRYEVVAINDLATPEMVSYLLKYDSIRGPWKWNDGVTCGPDCIYVNGKQIFISNFANGNELPWGNCGIDIVIECSGVYSSKAKAKQHIDAGADKVLISSPAGEDIPTIVYGVNTSLIHSNAKIISAASCSTNALAPMVMVLDEHMHIISGVMTVVHGYTSTQMLLDNSQKKNNLRRSRAAANNIIPTTAEAAKAVGLVIPSLKGKLIGSALRVPVHAGCFINFVAEIEANHIATEDINNMMKQNSSEVLGYTDEEIVSSDIIGIKHASLFDATQTMINKTSDSTFQIRVGVWFDNESSFVNQMIRCLHEFGHAAECK